MSTSAPTTNEPTTKSRNRSTCAILIGDNSRLEVECVGSVDVEFHGHTDARVTLNDVSYIPDLGFNLYSVHQFAGQT